MDDTKLIADIQSDDPQIRFAAWRAAGEATAAVIPELGRLAASSNPGKAKAAREALTTMTHSAGKDPAAPKRAAIVKALLEVAGSGAPDVRVHAIRLLSNIAGEDAVPVIARSFAAADLREEVAYCLERIPGEASEKALLAAYRQVPDDFKPRILAGLGHRHVSAALPLCVEAMASSRPDLAVAGARALGRIGARSDAAPGKPEGRELSAWQSVDWMDSMLRYADARAKAGDGAEAMRIYRVALQRPEEHWQCAAIIGIAKLGTPEAAAAILPKLKSGNSRIRITARNAWKTMTPA